MHRATSARGWFGFLVAASLLLPAHALAGAQGTGLPFVNAPTDAELHRFWMNAPGAPVPRLVCVDAPAIECFELDQTGFDPTRVLSPDCPAGPGARACRPDAIAGTSVTGRVDVDFLPSESWTRTDVSDQYSYNGCFGASLFVGPPNPATNLTVQDPQPGQAMYADRGDIQLFAGVDDDYRCGSWVRTRDADVGLVAPVALTVSLAEHAQVFVAYDATATVLPIWLTSSFAPTGDFIVLDDGLFPIAMAIYASPGLLPPGPVSFGGNRNDGANALFNYLVFVRRYTATELCGSLSATVSVQTPAGGWDVSQTIDEAGCGVLDVSGNYFEPPISIPGGLGWWGGQTPGSCDGFNHLGLPIEFERSLLADGVLDRAAFVEKAQGHDAVLCDPGAGGLCRRSVAMTMIDAQGFMEKGTPIAGDPHDCSFEVTFTDPGQTRVVLDGAAASDIDTVPQTVVDVSAGPDAAGVIDDLDLYVQTTVPFADNLRLRLLRSGMSVTLDERPGCDSAGAIHDVWFDDEAAAPHGGACGNLQGVLQPTGALASFDGGLVSGSYELEFLDLAVPEDGTDLASWQLRIRTTHHECNDDLDNDGDGLVDFDGGPSGGSPDPNCASPTDDQERRPPATCGLGPELTLLLPPLVALRRRRTHRAATN